jgi:hypothetical protein
LWIHFTSTATRTPLGNQFDSLVTDEGKLINSNWEGRWESKARIQEWGWSVEIKIPFKTMRIPSVENPIWGIDFKREIRRKNEVVVWNNYRRDFDFEQVSQAGHLEGLPADIRGLSLQIKPYIASGFRRTSVDDIRTTHRNFDVGLENVRYTVTPRIKLDTTINPDFAEAEVDEIQVNLTRFPLFFDEKREFFFEDAGLFEFGTSSARFGPSRPDVTLLHTRRIGLTADRRPLPINYGTRLTGQFSGATFGVMNVQTRDEADSPGTNYGVYRFKKNIFDRSYVGAMGTHVWDGQAGNNGSMGLDANFVLFRNLTLQSFLARSDSHNETGDGWSAMPLRALWNTDLWYIDASHLIVDRQFNPGIGFVGRSDIRKTAMTAEFSPRPRSGWIRQLEFGAELGYITDLDETLMTRNQRLGFDMDFQSGDAISVNFTRDLERQDEPFRLAGRLQVPAGIYRSNGWDINFRPYEGRWISADAEFSQGHFWGGRHTSIEAGPNFRWSDKLLTEIEYEYEKVRLPQGAFTSQVINTRIDFNATNRWLTATTIQYSQLDQQWGFNVRLNYIYRTGDDLFVVFNRILTDRDRSWSMLFKFTRTFEF